MIEEIKRRLEAGEVVELECVDKEGYKRENPDERWSVLNLDKIIVTSAQLVAVSIKNANVAIMRYELKYFRIKRPVPTFNDLIDVAVQAYKDGVCDSVEIDINNWLIVKSSTGNIHCHKNHLIHDNEFHINWIKSLYTETFVIENEEDISRVKAGADIELANGNKCTFLNNNDMWRIKDDKGFSHNCGLLVLKGATVTQKKI